jgi:CubicO group peptidase (beta-lactamase class C family)
MEHSFAVVEAGALTKAHGLDQPVPWWSFTKTILAAAALALVRDGRLALDRSIQGRPFTLRQLLRHQSGLADYGGLAAYHEAVARGDEPWPVSELLERTGARRLRYEPGQGWGYSNIGYLTVRELIEETAGEDLHMAISRLVLRPLDINGARIARTPADLAGVAMGAASSYHPGWAYHGLAVGPLRDAALLLDRLMTGTLLPPDLLEAMRQAHPVSEPNPSRPWSRPGSKPRYGLGLMSGIASSGHKAMGHTGAGPGSVIAVYHRPDAAPPLTAAAFAFGGDIGQVEEIALSRGQSRWQTDD